VHPIQLSLSHPQIPLSHPISSFGKKILSKWVTFSLTYDTQKKYNRQRGCHAKQWSRRRCDLVALVLPAGFSAQERISPSEAAKHVGKSATVCGKVASTAYAIQVVGRSTFLNLERPYPDQPFTDLGLGAKQVFPAT
jgi:hypothetical protein